MVIAASLAPGSRVLDVGCGDGGLVDRLGGLGYDALGVDPNAPSHARLIQERVEHATRLGHFDAITAVMALHHVELDAVASVFARLLRPGGRLFVSELAWEAYDERAAVWLEAKILRTPKTLFSAGGLSTAIYTRARRYEALSPLPLSRRSMSAGRTSRGCSGGMILRRRSRR